MTKHLDMVQKTAPYGERYRSAQGTSAHGLSLLSPLAERQQTRILTPQRSFLRDTHPSQPPQFPSHRRVLTNPRPVENPI